MMAMIMVIALASCKCRLLLCSTLVCEVTTPSLHSQILRSARGLLLRLNAIAMNPLPFWLKILETFLFPPSLTPMFRFHEFSSAFFLRRTDRESVGPRDIDCTFLYEIRKKFDVRKRLLWSRIAENATEVKAVGKSSIVRDLCFSLCKRLLSLPMLLLLLLLLFCCFFLSFLGFSVSYQVCCRRRRSVLHSTCANSREKRGFVFRLIYTAFVGRCGLLAECTARSIDNIAIFG